MREGNLAPMQSGRLLSWWCTLATIVLSVAILLALLKIYWPSIHEEFVLQIQCHLNDSHLARENSRLTMRIEELRSEVDAVSEEKKQCLNDNDMEHSAASRSFWTGVMACVCVELATGALLVCCWCWCLTNWLRIPPVRQRGYNWVTIR